MHNYMLDAQVQKHDQYETLFFFFLRNVADAGMKADSWEGNSGGKSLLELNVL